MAATMEETKDAAAIAFGPRSVDGIGKAQRARLVGLREAVELVGPTPRGTPSPGSLRNWARQGYLARQGAERIAFPCFVEANKLLVDPVEIKQFNKLRKDAERAARAPRAMAAAAKVTAAPPPLLERTSRASRAASARTDRELDRRGVK